MKRRDQRIKVMTCLYQYFLTNRSLDDLFDDNLDIDDKESIAFIVEETVSTVNNYDYLRGEIEKNLVETWEFDRLGFIEQSLLLMSANEILIDETDKGKGQEDRSDQYFKTRRTDKYMKGVGK